MIGGVTRTYEVKVANNLGTELILSLNCPGKFDRVFLSRSHKVSIPDLDGKHYPLKQ